jgi:hypothetical protein
MKRYFRSKWVRALAAVLAALAGTWAVGAVRDTYEVVKMTQKMKTICVGRMLIDLPAEATTELRGAKIDGFYVDAIAETPDAFQVRVAAREAEIRAKPDPHGGNKNLESTKEVKTDSGLVGKIFVHNHYVKETTAGYSLETLRRIRYEGVALEAHVHGDGISIEVTAKDYDPDRMENLPRLVAQLVANPDNHIPTESGFCVDRAYVRDPLQAKQREQIVLAAGLPSHPDISVRFDTLAGTKPESKGLLERSAASHARAPAVLNMRFTNLRAAPRTIGGLTGEELVERVIEENFAIIYGFEWEVNGTEDNVLVPDVTLTMATGRGKHGPVRSTWSQPAAVSLWDKISSSVRLRPTAVPQASVADPVTIPIGTLASAGDSCPQSGWWQCSEGGNGIGVLGGQTQYFEQGQRIPQALLLPPQTLWEKVRGLQPSFESNTPTAWKLADKRSRKKSAHAALLDQAKVIAPTVLEAAANTRPSIGSYLATGSSCPVSGWWRCEESHALDGTRWFAQGSLLPAATFAVPGAFAKSASVPKTIRRRGRWQLVRLAEAPETTRGG